MNTLQSVVKALNKAGFSDRDYRDLTPQVEPIVQPSPSETLDLFVVNAETTADFWGRDSITAGDNSMEMLRTAYPTGVSAGEDFVKELTHLATEQNKTYEAQAEAAVNADIPAALEDKMNKHKLKATFREQALTLKLPQFFTAVEDGGWIETAQLFERDYLLKAFKLSQADSVINFEDVETEMYRVDLEVVATKTIKPHRLK